MPKTNASWEGRNSTLDLAATKKAAMIFRAVNHKLRQQILTLIDHSGKIAVTDIYVKLRLEQSVASQHLAILRKEGFVKTERDGKFIYYSVDDNYIKFVNELAKKLGGE